MERLRLLDPDTCHQVLIHIVLKATRHRVVAKPGDRRSVILHLHPNFISIIAAMTSVTMLAKIQTASCSLIGVTPRYFFAPPTGRVGKHTITECTCDGVQDLTSTSIDT